MKSKRLNFRVTEELFDIFQDQVKEERRNQTQHFTELIKEEEKRRKRKR